MAMGRHAAVGIASQGSAYKHCSLHPSHPLSLSPLNPPLSSCHASLSFRFLFLSKTLTPPMPTLRFQFLQFLLSSQLFSQFLFSLLFFLAENQTRWRKRKRDSQISRRHQKHEEEEEEEDDDDDDENPNGATRSTIRRTKRTTTTVIRNLTWRRRSSPTTAFRCRSSRQ